MSIASSGNQGRIRRGVLFVLLLATLVGSTGCKWSQKRNKPLAERPPMVADDPAAQASFDEARAALEQGRYEESAKGFELVQASHGDDAIAPLAELYAARARLGLLTPGFGTLSASAPQRVVEEQRATFAALADARRIDDRVKWTARLYLALTTLALGDASGAVASLDKYPSASLSNLVLEADQLAAWFLVQEQMHRSDRPEEALMAAAMLHERAATLQDVALADRIMRYARGRGVAYMMHDISVEDLHMQFFTSDIPFLKGLAGWAVIVRSEGKDEETRAMLEDLFAQSSGALVEIGALEQVGEASARLATMGTSKRLMIGALVPMQGKERPIGLRVMRGMLLAQKAFSVGQSPRLTLVFRDSTLDAQANMAWFDELGVLGVVGPIEKERVPAYAEAATAAEIALLTLSTEALPVRADQTDFPWVFRNFLDAQAEAVAVARLSATQYGDRTAAIIWPNIGYGQSMARAFKQAFEAAGGRIVAEVEYPRADTEFTRTAAKVAAAKPDAIFIADTGTKVSEITAFLAKENVWGVGGSQALDRKSRLQTHYLGTSLWQDAFLLRQSSSYVIGATVPSWYSTAARDDASVAFTTRYKEVYAAEPTVYEAFAYDSVRWLSEVIVERGLQRPATVRDALMHGTWKGVTGSVDFTPSGEPSRELRFVTVKGGSFAPLEVTQVVEAPGTPVAPALQP